MSYFNLLSIFDGSTCYCPDCIGERFSIFTPEETTEVVETVESVATVTDIQSYFGEVISTFLSNKLFVGLFLCCVSFGIISTIFNFIRRVINGE